jgi:hypothetical protein
MFFGVVVNAPRKPANNTRTPKAMKRQIYSLPATDGAKLCGYKNAPSSTSLNGRKYPCINRLWRFFTCHVVRNPIRFFLQNQEEIPHARDTNSGSPLGCQEQGNKIQSGRKCDPDRRLDERTARKAFPNEHLRIRPENPGGFG